MLCESPVRDTASEDALQEVIQEEHQRLQEPQLPMLRPVQLWAPQPAPVSEPLEGPTQMWGQPPPEPLEGPTQMWGQPPPQLQQAVPASRGRAATEPADGKRRRLPASRGRATAKPADGKRRRLRGKQPKRRRLRGKQEAPQLRAYFPAPSPALLSKNVMKEVLAEAIAAVRGSLQFVDLIAPCRVRGSVCRL